jgi:hypothetical protein
MLRMNYNRYWLAIILSLTIIFLGCGSNSNIPATAKNVKVSATTQINSADPVKGEPDTIVEPYADIVEKDIFTPPDMRSSMKAPILVEERIIEPQKLTITGIVFDGNQFLVSVENLETNESHYLKINDPLLDYSIVTIDFEKVTAKKKKELKILQVGDQIPIPGTGTQRLKESAISEDISDSDTTNIKTETGTSLPPAGDSFEERLRKRRQQQEEELK